MVYEGWMNMMNVGWIGGFQWIDSRGKVAAKRGFHWGLPWLEIFHYGSGSFWIYSEFWLSSLQSSIWNGLIFVLLIQTNSWRSSFLADTNDWDSTKIQPCRTQKEKDYRHGSPELGKLEKKWQSGRSLWKVVLIQRLFKLYSMCPNADFSGATPASKSTFLWPECTRSTLW